MVKPVDSEYYQHTGNQTIAGRLSYRARSAVYRTFLDVFHPGPATRILDIGVTDQVSLPAANLFEQLYPHRSGITCAGICDGEPVKAAYPGVKFVRLEPHAPLPFEDGEFDVVYSNAVLEHVGSEIQQRHFVREACRVAKGVFIVVPNPLFPVEVHTGIPLVHYLPKPAFRALLMHSRWKFWAAEENLNYVSARQLKSMYPASRQVTIRYAGIGFGQWQSNIISCSKGS